MNPLFEELLIQIIKNKPKNVVSNLFMSAELLPNMDVKKILNSQHDGLGIRKWWIIIRVEVIIGIAGAKRPK